MGAFAAALRRRQISRPDKNDLVAGTVQETLAKLGEVFRANVGYNPTHGVGSHSFHPALLRQFKGMQNEDPGEVQQKALPVCVYRELHRLYKIQNSDHYHLDESIAWILAICCRFC
jgi:hypothetical protein